MAIEVYDELLNTIRDRIKVVVKNDDCVTVLIMTNALLRFVYGKHYNDFIRDVYLMNKEKTLWSETIWHMLDNERPELINRTGVEEIDHYGTLYLIAFDIVLAITMNGAWKSPVKKKIAWVFKTLHDRGYNHVDATVKNILRFQKDFNFPIFHDGTKADIKNLKKMFFIPQFYGK